MEYNYYKLTKIIRSVHYLFTALLAIVATLAIFFAFKWYDSVHSDIAYFVSPDSTHLAHKLNKSSSISRQDFELQNFACDFLERAFSHNEYTLEDNLSKAINVMDKQSGLYLLSKFGEDIEELYKKYNAISTVSLESIETNMKSYPYEVLLTYRTMLHFPKGDNVLQDSELQGGIYFEVECLQRNVLNPYGMLIKNLRFVDPLFANDDKNK
jgi:hypothetical protein